MIRPDPRDAAYPGVEFEYDTDRVAGSSRFPGQSQPYRTEGGPLAFTGSAKVLPDRIIVQGQGSYYPSVPARDGRPDWVTYFDATIPLVYVWRPDR